MQKQAQFMAKAANIAIAKQQTLKRKKTSYSTLTPGDAASPSGQMSQQASPSSRQDILQGKQKPTNAMTVQ